MRSRPMSLASLIEARNPQSAGTFELPIRWNRSARSLRLVPAFGDDGIPQAVDHFVAHVEKARAFGRLQPFVRARGIHVAAEVVNVQSHHAGDVRAIDGGENAFRAGERAEFFRGQNDAGERSDVAEEDDAGAWSDGIVEEIENLRGVFHRAGQA